MFAVVEKRNRDMVLLLLICGAYVKYMNSAALLYKAVSDDLADIVPLLLSDESNVNAEYENKNLLSRAAELRSTPLRHELLWQRRYG